MRPSWTGERTLSVPRRGLLCIISLLIIVFDVGIRRWLKYSFNFDFRVKCGKLKRKIALNTVIYMIN
mgnify:CR=1 FL=1